MQKVVKYLGVKVTADKKDQAKAAREQIDKNIKVMRWKLGRADSDVIQQLVCCLARSMLIYIGTPMVAAGLWKRKEIDRIEASLYRRILRVGNMIPNRAILNTMTSIRLAGEVVNYLAKGAWVDLCRRRRVGCGRGSRLHGHWPICRPWARAPKASLPSSDRSRVRCPWDNPRGGFRARGNK